VEFDPERLVDIFARFEFRTLIEEFLPDEDPSAADRDYTLITTEKQLESLVAQLRKAGEFAVDTETTSTDPMAATLVGISMSVAENSGCYIPVGHDADLLEVQQLPLDRVIEALRPIFADENLGKIGHN